MSPRDDVGHSQSLTGLIARRAREQGAATYLRAARDGRVVSYDDLRAHCERRRDELGGAVDRVALTTKDPLDYAIDYVAVVASGRWVIPLDPELAERDAPATCERALRLGATHLLGEAGLTPLSDAAANSAEAASPHAGGVIMATSGTTGTPKVMRLGVVQLRATATNVVESHGLTTADLGFNPLPLFHINAQVVGLLAALHAGAGLVLDERFHRTGFWALVDSFGVTWINAVPAIISRLIPLRDDESVPASVRFVRSASAPLAVSLMKSFEAETGLAVVESYGMTEAGSQICVNPLEARRPGSVGRPWGVALRVARDDETPAAPGETGHVQISGPTVIERYEGPGYEDRFSADGWLRTGDLGHLNAAGYLFLTGRTDDVINRGGEKIFPREIEELLVSCPEVEAAAVIGVPDEVFGQVPVAFVQLHGVDDTSDPERVAPLVKDLRETLVNGLARPRRPVRITVVAALPAHVNGKIRRDVLATQPPVGLISETVG
jgi:acyl-CoA synthetase (AMP-forming)/AMP-acid ligase II